MTLFHPMRDFFQRRQVARLDALSSGLQLVTLRSESVRGNFVFPGQGITAAIEQHGQRVGHQLRQQSTAGPTVYQRL